MIIERIQIDRFGALDRVTVDGLSAGVEVLHGTNETGKTSLLEFVRGVLFGFTGRSTTVKLNGQPVPCVAN